MLTDRDIEILKLLVHYYVLSRQQIQRLLFPGDEKGRITRRRLQALVDEHLINRQTMLYCHPASGSPAPVYFPSRKGCEFLAEHLDDERFLATPTQAPIPHHVLHWLAVSETHIVLDKALKSQTGVHCDGWLNEWDTVNKDESAPEKRYRIYMLLREQPRLVCAPDAAFLLSVAGHRKVFYLEQDRTRRACGRLRPARPKGTPSWPTRNSTGAIFRRQRSIHSASS